MYRLFGLLWSFLLEPPAFHVEEFCVIQNSIGILYKL